MNLDLQTEINRLTQQTTEINETIRQLKNDISAIEKNPTYIKNTKNLKIIR